MTKKKILEKFFQFFDSYPREYFLLGFFLLFALFLLSVVSSYTIMNKSFYKALADKQQIGETIIPVTRGSILSSTNNGSVLATNVNLYDIAVDPQMIGDKQKLAFFLTDIVYKETCLSQTEKDCYEHMLRFLKVLEIPGFTSNEDLVKNLISKQIEERINRKRMTSVLLGTEIDLEKIQKISLLRLPGVYPSDSSLYVNPEEIGDEDYVANNLSEILGTPLATMKELIKKRDIRYVAIINRISIALSDEVNRYLDEEKEAIKKGILDEERSIFNFIILTPSPSRYYPEKALASQIIGMTDKEGVGHYGIEGYFDDVLRGEKNQIVSKKDILGRTIDPIDFETDGGNTAGANVYTTIDRNVQSKVEKILEDGVKKYKANKGSVIVMNPKSGEIIAMANYPSFDPNSGGDVYEIEKISYANSPNPKLDLLGKIVLVEDKLNGKEFIYNAKKIYLRIASIDEVNNTALVKYKYKNDFGAGVYKNDIISSIYEPGSIMKAITVAIGIDTGEIKRYDMYNDTGEVQIDNFKISNVSQNCLGYKSFANALNFSCNVGMIRIAQKIGPALFSQYLHDFGFGKLTDITLDGEVTGNISPYQKWSKAQLFTSSFGLGIGATPLQMATAYSAIANGGLYIKPRIVKSVEYPNGKIIQYKKEVGRRVIKETTAEIVTDMLVDSTTNGVAKTGAVPGYTLAGKTGTSQIASRGGYETGIGSTVASYAGFGPAEDPEFVIIVKLERSRVDIYGGTTSSKIFAETAKYLFDYYGIPSKEIKQ